jgi:hypothetical protein
MPTFQVRAPDGRVYSVNTPDGSVEADAIRFVQRKYAQGKPPEPSRPKAAPQGRSWGQSLLSAAGTVVDGALGSWSDEAYAAGRTARHAIDSAMGKEEFAPAKRFNQAQTEYTRMQQPVQSSVPSLSLPSKPSRPRPVVSDPLRPPTSPRPQAAPQRSGEPSGR